jgi:hypothetical protein|tara:strand:- start:1232 stop:1678 length:447 start_codon:yes stop_codon:yes gene_type:complete
MLDLKSILDMWKDDCEISRNDLAESSRLTPTLHAKYLEILSTTKLNMKRAEFQQKTLLKNKWLYYNGKMDQSELEAFGWDPDPFQGLKVLKGEMEYYYDADPEIQKSEEKIQYLKTIVDTLSEIVENIKWRHQTIGNMIKWRQFESGS